MATVASVSVPLRLGSARRRMGVSLLALVVGGPALLPTAGCATLVNGGSQGIRVESEPAGADVFLGAEKKGVTPLKVQVSRKETTAVLRIEKVGFAPVRVPLKRNVSAAISWDLLFGGSAFLNPNSPVGVRLLVAIVATVGTVTIDYVTGGLYTLTPGNVTVALEQAKKDPQEPAPVVDRNSRR